MQSPPIALVATLLFVSGSLAQAQQARSTPYRSEGPLADSLREYGVRIGTLLRAMNTAAVLDLYGAHDAFVHVENGTALSWPELSSMIRTYFATADSNPVSIIGEPYVLLIDRNNAVLMVQHRMEAVAARPAHTGVWSGVLHRTDAGWKIVHSHSSDVTPSRSP